RDVIGFVFADARTRHDADPAGGEPAKVGGTERGVVFREQSDGRRPARAVLVELLEEPLEPLERGGAVSYASHPSRSAACALGDPGRREDVIRDPEKPLSAAIRDRMDELDDAPRADPSEPAGLVVSACALAGRDPLDERRRRDARLERDAADQRAERELPPPMRPELAIAYRLE